MFAQGYIYFAHKGTEIRVHVAEMLANYQRRVYAFGTTSFGERDKLVAITKIVDRNGNIVSETPSPEV